MNNPGKLAIEVNSPSNSAEENLRKLTRGRMLRNSFITVIDRILLLGFGIILSVLFARLLGAKSLGTYTLSMTLAGLTSILPNFGIHVIANRAIALNPAKLPRYLGNGLGIRLCISLPLTVALSAGVAIIFGYPPEILPSVILASLYVHFTSNVLFLTGTLTALHRNDKVIIFNAVHKSVTVISAAAALFAGFTLADIFVVLIVITIGIFIYMMRFIKSLFPDFRITFSYRFGRIFILKSVPLVSSAIAEGLSLKVDTLLIGKLGSISAVGLYSTAANIFLAIVMLPLAISKIFLPNFLALQKNSTTYSFELLSKVRNWFLVYTFVSIAAIFLLAPFIINLMYGPEFRESVPALYVLSLALPAIICNRLYNYALIGLKEDGYYLNVTLFGAAVNIISNLILIPLYSIIGAAISTIISEYFVFYISYQRVRRHNLAALAAPPQVQAIREDPAI